MVNTDGLDAMLKAAKFKFRTKNIHVRCGLAEFLGTFILILFGCGSVAQMELSGFAKAQFLSVNMAFGYAVTAGAYVCAGVSDALHVYSGGNWTVAGPQATAGIFASYPSEHLSVINGFTDQVIATAALLICILAVVDERNSAAPRGLQPFVIGLMVLLVGLAMGFNCGYPINPARDLGPRLFTAIAGWGFEVFRAGNHWWWVPVLGPLVGGLIGAIIYELFVEIHHPLDEEKEVLDDHCPDHPTCTQYELVHSAA
ncbi:aquaporin-3-like isoform X2 [Lissotriton helveticus]